MHIHIFLNMDQAFEAYGINLSFASLEEKQLYDCP